MLFLFKNTTARWLTKQLPLRGAILGMIRMQPYLKTLKIRLAYLQLMWLLRAEKMHLKSQA